MAVIETLMSLSVLYPVALLLGRGSKLLTSLFPMSGVLGTRLSLSSAPGWSVGRGWAPPVGPPCALPPCALPWTEASWITVFGSGVLFVHEAQTSACEGG